MRLEENKSIIFYYSQFNVGGAEKSNLRLINFLVKKGWKVTLLLRYANGTMESLLPKEVRIYYLANKNFPVSVLAEKRKIWKVIKAFVFVIPYLFQKLFAQRVIHQLKKEKFDVAVIGLQGLNPRIITNRIKAEVRLLWIRSDVSHCNSSGHVTRNIKKYGEKIDYFPCVSKSAYASFLTSFPQYKHKARVFYNVINAQEMVELGKEPCELEGLYLDALKVITVCRISNKSKGVFRMLDIYKRLRESGIFFYWLVVGDGPDMQELINRVKRYHLEDGFILLGRKENPFPFYKYCDVSATLSYYEGLCGTVNEAKIMGLPVIATEFSGIHEQITDGENGWILQNNEDAIFEGMRRIIMDSSLIKVVRNNFLPDGIANDDYKEHMLIQFLEEKRQNS